MRRAIATVAAILAVAATIAGGAALRAGPSGAVVRPAVGYRATVDGWSSWYGSYDLGALGRGWCLDHGIASPDPDLAYVPTDLAVAPEKKVALAWLYGANVAAADTDRVVAAAVMLAGHDLLDARYPSGVLRVDRLSSSRLAGFGADGPKVLATARRLRADALAHQSLVAPLRLTVDRVQPGTYLARLVDAAGKPVVGATLRGGDGLTPATVTSDADGSATFRAFAAEPPTAVVEAAVPDLSLHAHRPTKAPAQRVAIPAHGSLRAEGRAAAGRPLLTIDKAGVAVDGLTRAGARFSVQRQATWSQLHLVETGADGRTPPLALEPGTYEVRERAAPPGYATAGPWTVTVPDTGEVVLTIADQPLPRPVVVTKLDARTHLPVIGAALVVRHPGGPDVASTTTAPEPWRLALPPGRYEVAEVTAPPGYAALDDPVAFDVAPMLPGSDATPVALTLLDVPLTSLAFAKTAVGPVDPAHASLAGAVFVVRSEADRPVELGRCTTGADGRCALPPAALRHEVEVCWTEEVAPVGFAPAAGGCVMPVASDDGATVTIPVAERSRFTAVSGHKTDPDGRPLAGAVVELARRETGGLTVVGRATSGDDGALAFALQVPGAVYCAVERSAPSGYELDAMPVCTDGPLVEGTPAVLTIVDRPTPAPSTTVVATTIRPTAAPTTVAPATTTTTTTTTTNTTKVAVMTPVETIPSPPVADVAAVEPVQPATPPGRLPRTGSDRLLPMALLGGTLVLIGASLLVARPPRTALAHPPEGTPHLR